MLPRTTIVSVLALVAIACTACYFLRDEVPAPSPAGTAAPAADTGALAQHQRTSSGPETAPVAASEKEWHAIMDQMKNGASSPSVSESDARRFLEAKGETPANVIAAWLCTRDAKWLDRALELHPNNPLVLFAKLGASDPKALDPDLIRRFNEAAPDNPLSKIFEARHFFNTGDQARAIDAVQEALKRPGFYTWMNETTGASRTLYEFTGMPSVLADLISTFQMPMPHLAVVQGVAKGMTDAFSKQSPPEDANVILMTYQLGRMFATPEASRTLIGQLVGFSLEKRALNALPPGSKPDWLPVVPNDRIAEIDARKGGIFDATANSDWLLGQRNAELLTQYLRRYRGEGETSAMQWLSGQRAAAASKK